VEAVSDEEMFAIMDGMEEVNRQMVTEMEASAPRCHMRPMFMDSYRSGDEEESWWECSVCGHTKLI
jgi:hypothetical protein